MALAFFERRLHRLALGDLLAQFQVGGGQFHRPLAQRLDEFLQMDGGLLRAAMGFLNRGDRRGKENPRLLDERGALAGRAARQDFRDQGLLVQLGQVQRLKSGRQGLAPQSSRRLQARLAALVQMRLQRRPIASRQIEDVAFHGFLNSWAARRTDRADFATIRCVLAISFFRPAVFSLASFFNESSRTFMPSKVWAISS